MVNEFLKLLKDNDEEKIRHYIFEKELEFYENERLNSVILSQIGLEEYDKLALILKIADKEPVYSNVSEDKSSENDFKIYTTNIYNLFLVKKDEFSELIFVNDIKKLIGVREI